MNNFLKGPDVHYNGLIRIYRDNERYDVYQVRWLTKA